MPNNFQIREIREAASIFGFIWKRKTYSMLRDFFFSFEKHVEKVHRPGLGCQLRVGLMVGETKMLVVSVHI